MLSRKQLLLSLAALPVVAHAATSEAPLPSASVNAHVSMEVPQDQVRATLYIEQTGNDRTTLVPEVNGALQRALLTAKSASGVTAKTGGYRSFPLYDKNQHVSGYR